MIWIAIAIIIVAVIIARHYKKMEDLKKSELEVDPEYRRVVYIKEQITEAQKAYEDHKRNKEKMFKYYYEAVRKQDKKAQERWDLEAIREGLEIKEQQLLLEKYRKQLAGINNQEIEEWEKRARQLLLEQWKGY